MKLFNEIENAVENGVRTVTMSTLHRSFLMFQRLYLVLHVQQLSKGPHPIEIGISILQLRESRLLLDLIMSQSHEVSRVRI